MKISSEIFLFFFSYFCSKHRLLVHDLCFGAKIRKIGIPLHTPVLLYKIGVQEGMHYMEKCFSDVKSDWQIS